MAIAEKVARAVVEYTGKDSQFQQTAKGVQRTNKITAKTFRNVALAAVGLATAFAAVAKSALNTAENINDMSNKANASVRGLQELRFAADQNGASMRDMDDALTRLTRRMSLFAADGGGPAAKAIETLGLSIFDAAGNLRQSDQVFLEIAEKFQGLATDAEKAALASQLFGEDAGPRLVPLLNQGVAGIKEFTDQANRMGIVLDEAGIRKAAAVNAQFRALGMQFKTNFTRAIVENADAFERLAVALGDMIANLPAWVDKISDFAADVAWATGLLADAWELYQKARPFMPFSITVPNRTGIKNQSTSTSPVELTVPPPLQFPTRPSEGPSSYGGGLADRLATMETSNAAILAAQNNAQKEQLASAGAFNAEMTGIMHQAAVKQVALQKNKHARQIAQTGQFFGAMATAFQSGNEKMQRIARIAGAAQALINAYVGASEALKLPFPANLGAMASVLSAGMGLVSAIRSGSQSASAGASGGGAGVVPPAAASPSGTYVRVNLMGGDMFSGDAVRGLIGKINEAVEDGAVIRGITA